MGLFDDLDPKDLKPQNVTEATAEAFLRAAGWVKDFGEDEKWISPQGRVRHPRGKAVVRQFQEDFVRLVFVMQHTPPEFLTMLIPPSVLEKVQEVVEKAVIERLEKEAKEKGPAN